MQATRHMGIMACSPKMSQSLHVEEAEARTCSVVELQRLVLRELWARMGALGFPASYLETDAALVAAAAPM